MVVFDLYTPQVNWLSVYFLLLLHRSLFGFFLNKKHMWGDLGAVESLQQRRADCCGWMFEMSMRNLLVLRSKTFKGCGNQHFNLQSVKSSSLKVQFCHFSVFSHCFFLYYILTSAYTYTYIYICFLLLKRLLVRKSEIRTPDVAQ